MEKLSLRTNLLVELDVNTFANLKKLHTLDLSYNKFKEFKSDIFKGLTKLKKLLLSHNSFIAFDINIIISLNSLNELDLEDNAINSIDIYTFNKLRLKKVKLEGNPIYKKISYQMVNKSLLFSYKELEMLHHISAKSNFAPISIGNSIQLNMINYLIIFIMVYKLFYFSN